MYKVKGAVYTRLYGEEAKRLALKLCRVKILCVCLRP
jgi:hypothetical protein